MDGCTRANRAERYRMCPEFGKGAGFVLWRRALGGMEIGRFVFGVLGFETARSEEGVRDGEVGFLGCVGCVGERREWIWVVGEREREGQVLVLELRFMHCETGTEPWRIVAKGAKTRGFGTMCSRVCHIIAWQCASESLSLRYSTEEISIAV